MVGYLEIYKSFLFQIEAEVGILFNDSYVYRMEYRIQEFANE